MKNCSRLLLIALLAGTTIGLQGCPRHHRDRYPPPPPHHDDHHDNDHHDDDHRPH